MSDPTLSDIDFKNKMAWVWTTLKLDPNHNDEIGLEQICMFWVGTVIGSEHGLVLERARIRH